MSRARHYSYELVPIRTVSARIPLKQVRGKARPRISTRGGFARAYTDSKTVAAESEIKRIWTMDKGTDMAGFDGPFEIRVLVQRALPKSAPAARIGEPDIGKPDADNVVKLVIDSLQGIAFRDDCQCVYSLCAKGPRLPYGQPDQMRIEIRYLSVRKELMPDKT